MKKKLFVVSDVHGHCTLLKQALAEAGFDKENPDHLLICCGDYFDRGEENVEVLKFFEQLKHCVLLRGNHEDLLLKLLDTGMHRVFISMGGDGVYAADRTTGTEVQLPVLPGEMVNTTGCGDAFMAALVWAYLEGMELEESARAGLAAGSIALESSQTINPDMSAEALKARLE